MSAGRLVATKAPIVIGGGLVTLTLAGAAAAVFGLALPLAAEALAATIGMVAGARVA